jgi:hypothetical protein
MFERNLENLNLCVESIKGQFGHILNKHEQDFIRAYQVCTIICVIDNIVTVLHGEGLERVGLSSKPCQRNPQD